MATKGTLDIIIKEGTINRIYTDGEKKFMFLFVDDAVMSIDISHIECTYKTGQNVKIVMNGFRHV